MEFHLINFYKFVELKDVQEIERQLRLICVCNNLLGKIILAEEGINVALSGEKFALENFVREIKLIEAFSDITAKWSIGKTKPFRRMLFKIKPAIVTFSKNDPKPDAINSMPRLSPAEWREVLKSKNEDVVFVDTRNDYECDWGTFEGADLLPIKKFSDFPKEFAERYKDQKDKKFMIFCTGGIRCEKAAPWIAEQGFDKVYQLDGGILKYLEEFGNDSWNGSCFVFDQRWALNDTLQETNQAMAQQVLQPKPDKASTAI